MEDHTTIRPESPLNIRLTCPACNGTGQITEYGEGTTCAGCDGKGFYTPPATGSEIIAQAKEKW